MDAMDEQRQRNAAESLTERLARLFGADVDPHVSLTPISGTEPVEEVVSQLRREPGARQRYEVRGEIDRGGMGVVLEVWDRELRRSLAMKVALDGALDGVSDRRRVARFLEEAQITAQLDHPGVVPVHELGVDDDGRVFFTMRRVRGRDLREVLHCVHFALDGWNETRALTVLLRACEAVAFAHSRGVVHRDLKPANIMVGEFGEVYVLDWGLARVLGRAPSPDERDGVSTVRSDEREGPAASPLATSDGDVLGTPAYMSPEQARGRLDELTPRTDVYALGAMLYHLLAHEPPYFPEGRPTSQVEALQSLLRGPPRPLTEIRERVPVELVAICEKAMRFAPQERYADVRELAADLRAFLEQRVVAAHATGHWAQARKWVQRNRPLVVALAAGLLALVGGFATTLWQFQRAESRAAEASESALLANARADEVLRLSDLQRLSELEREAEGLWPALPEQALAMTEWLTRADALLGRLPSHRESLERWSAELRVEDSGDRATLRWQHERMVELVEGLTRFSDPLRGRRADVAARFALASSLRARSIDGAADVWREAIEAVRADPKYGGLELKPQIGLVPLGRDPDSNLWEFAHLLSGEPARRAPDGRLQIEEASGVVLVLVPPGSFLMGAQADDPAAPGYDPLALPGEGPPREVEVAAFFLSKYELTQAQWLRATGDNPSVFSPERFDPSWNADGSPGDLTHPVEKVSWLDCARVLPRLDLELPREAQWEYAARAGTVTPWWTGASPASLNGFANLSTFDSAASSASPQRADFADGRACHAPVGAFPANPFGLHDVAGNVFEWCAADFASSGEEPANHPRRGGGWVLGASLARSACRNVGVASFHSQSLGVRPARALR